MPAGTSLGSGIALQSGNRNDYWMRKLADDWATRRAVKEKAKQEKEKQSGDNKKWFLGQITVPAGEWAKMYLDNVHSVLENAYAQAEPLYEAGDITALHKIASDAQIKIADIKSNNDRGVAYYKNPNIIKNTEATKTFFSDGATYADMLQFNNVLAKNPLHGINGEVAVDVTIPNKFEIETLTPDAFEYENNGKPTGKLQETNELIFTRVNFVSDAKKQQKVNQLKSDINYMQFAFSRIINSKAPNEIAKLDLDRANGETPEQFLQRNPDFAQEVDLFTRKFVDDNSSQPVREPTKASPPKATKGSKKDESKLYLYRHDSPQTVPYKTLGTRTLTQEQKKKMGLPEWASDTRIPFQFDQEIDISKVGKVSISVTDDMIDLNPELEGVSSINVEPGTLYRSVIDNKWYSTGTTINYYTADGEYILPDEKNAKIMTSNVLIPLDRIYGKLKSTKGYNDIDKYIYGDTGNVQNIGGTKNNAPKGGTIR